MHESYGKSDCYEVIPLNYFRLLYFKKNYDNILTDLPLNSKILEIGPGGGTFAEYLLQCGFKNITLCEYSTVIASKLKQYFSEKPDIKIIQENALVHLKDNATKYDVVIAIEVIEHFNFEDFIILLKDIYLTLNENGLVILETNNCANFIYGMYLRYCDHTHLLGFTPRSLMSFLETENFHVGKIFPIYMTGLKDVVLSVLQDRFRKKRNKFKSFNKEITHTSFTAKIKLGMLFLLRSVGILISRVLSFLLIYPYDVSLGMTKTVFTPTFGITAQKVDAINDGKVL